MSHAELPVGPPWMRASDVDREKVAAVLRTHYGAGRLDDAELEQRMTRVLAAKTLSQLRDEVADLPSPPPSLGRRMAGGARAVRHPVGIWLSILFGLLVIGVLTGGASHDSSSATAVAPAISAGPLPSATAAPEPASHIRSVRAGGTGVDDGVAVRVRRVTRRTSVLVPDENPNRLFAGPGHEYAIVSIDYSNRSDAKLEPFCGENGSTLFSRAHRGFQPVEGEYKLVGNDAMCGGGLQPGEAGTARLLFRVPNRTRFAWIDLWNGDAKNDILGKTRLRLHLDGIPGA